MVVYVTTANTLLNPTDVFPNANRNRVAICHATVWEIPNASTPYNPNIIVGPTVLMNRELNSLISPQSFTDCPQFTGTITLLQVNNIPPPPGDPDPIELQE
jgi:hypothetical protein